MLINYFGSNMHFIISFQNFITHSNSQYYFNNLTVYFPVDTILVDLIEIQNTGRRYKIIMKTMLSNTAHRFRHYIIFLHKIYVFTVFVVYMFRCSLGRRHLSIHQRKCSTTRVWYYWNPVLWIVEFKNIS